MAKKYIDAERLKSEIERLYDGEAPKHDQQCDFDDGYFTGIGAISKLIDSLQQEQLDEQPEYGYLSTKYVHGKKSRWSIGDVLAYYICTSNEEGEYTLGKIVNVEFDEDWIYTFEDGNVADEQSLVEDEAYKKN